MKTFISLIILCFFSAVVLAQPVEMATDMRSSGKIYVVVAVIAVIFIGLAVYLFSIDKRLKKIEKNS